MSDTRLNSRFLMAAVAVVAALLLASPVEAGKIGGDDAGRCERLASEGGDSYCGGMGSDGSCSCAASCVSAGTCCDDYQPVCASNFQCTPSSGQIVFLHQNGMCSTKWSGAGYPGRLANVSAIPNAISVNVKAVQTDHVGTQVAAKTLARYMDACCTGSNSCIVYNYSNGDSVVGYALDQLWGSWNILEVRTTGGTAGGSELAEWSRLAELFSCQLSSQIAPSQLRNLYNHNNTRGVPIHHMGGYLDAKSGSDDPLFDAGWWFLPWHSDGTIAYHSSGARNTAVEWCGDGRFLKWNWSFWGYWCTDQDLCSSNYGTLWQGHSIAYCPMKMKNSDHADQKMEYIYYLGQ